MKLYLMRHGVACGVGGSVLRDSDRTLTDEGSAEIRGVADRLVHIGMEISVVYCSPLIRARQTAGIISDALHPKLGLTATDALLSGTPLKSFLEFLQAENLPAAARVFAVGHMPSVGEWLEQLLKGGLFIFREGTIAALDLSGIPPSLPANLLWYASPKVLGVKK